MSSSFSKKQLVRYGVMILGSGALLATLDGKGNWLAGWLGYSSVILLSALAIFGVWKQVKGNRKTGSIALTAYLLRAGLGVFFMLSLPSLGYQDNLASKAGYLYRDAFVRDQQAWELATSGKSLWQAFSGTYSGDQYGGFLAFSALIYRTLGFGVHRPWLVTKIQKITLAKNYPPGPSSRLLRRGFMPYTQRQCFWVPHTCESHLYWHSSHSIFSA
jgi:hypothetical protein